METKISYELINGYVRGWHIVGEHTPAMFDREYIIFAGTEKELAEKEQFFNDNYCNFREKGGTLAYDSEHDGWGKIEAEAQAQRRMAEIKARLSALSEDIVQSLAGEVVPGMESRKAEFVALHNELRALEGKEPREVL